MRFHETHQQEMERVGLGNLKSAQEAGFQLIAVTPLDGTVQENAQAAVNNLQQVKNNNGGLVPEGLLHIHAGNSNGIFTLQLANPTAALDTVNTARRAQGMPSYDSRPVHGATRDRSRCAGKRCSELHLAN